MWIKGIHCHKSEGKRALLIGKAAYSKLLTFLDESSYLIGLRCGFAASNSLFDCDRVSSVINSGCLQDSRGTP